MTSRYLLYAVDENPGLARGLGRVAVIVNKEFYKCLPKTTPS